MLLEQELAIAIREAETAAILEKLTPKQETKLLPVYQPLLLCAPKPKRQPKINCIKTGPVIYLADCDGFKPYHVCATYDASGYIETIKVVNAAVVKGNNPANSIEQYKTRNEAIARKKWLKDNYNKELLLARAALRIVS